MAIMTTKKLTEKEIDKTIVSQVDDDSAWEKPISIVRGKHAKALRAGYTITIHKEDGSTVVETFTPQENAVTLEPDVREYFPDSQSVNEALRSLIGLMEKMPPRKYPSGKSHPRQVAERKKTYK
jgi:hypothetical protein